MKNTFIYAFLIILMLLPGCAAPPASTQPAVVAAATLAQTNPPPTPQIPERQADWTLPLSEGDFWAPLSVSKGLLFAGGDDGFLYAVDTSTRSIIWKFQTGGFLRSQPTAGSEFVYVTSDDGYVYAVAIADGSLKWKRQVAEKPTKRGIPFGESSWQFNTPAPLLHGGRLFVAGPGGSLSAMNPQTGDVAWTFQTDGSIQAALSPQVDDNRLIFGDRFGVIYALDLETGKQVWTNKTGDGIQASGFALIKHVIYFAGTGYMHAIDAQSGKGIWQTPAAYCSMTPAFRDGVLFVDYWPDTAGSPGIAAYDAASGNRLRVVFKNGNNRAASPVLGKTWLYIGYVSDSFYAIDPESGAIQWQIPVKSETYTVGVAATAVVSDGMVYFAGMDGKLYAVKDE